MPIVSTPLSREVEAVHSVPRTAIEGILKKLTGIELPGKEHLEYYMRHKWRLNHKSKTFLSSFGSIVSFLTFYQASGRSIPACCRQVFEGEKNSMGRVVYLSEDARSALQAYLKKRLSKAKGLFLVQKGPITGKPISVRGIQKRIEYYGRKSKVKVSCHQLRHTMATQLLNADAALVTIQDLLGHGQITTTQRYCRVSNLKVQRDYYKAIEVVLQRTQSREDDELELDEKWIKENRV